MPGTSKSSLSESQLRRIADNKARAQQLLKVRVVKRGALHDGQSTGANTCSQSVSGAVEAKKCKHATIQSMRDSGGGFFIEEHELLAEDGSVDTPLIPNYEPYETAMQLGDSDKSCEKCNRGFQVSFLLDKFSHPVCDICYSENKDDFPLVTKTAAKSKYVLRDADFDRESSLRYIVRANPHNPRWGQMKLYLESQVEKLAVGIWGSLDNIEAEIDKRDARTDASRKKKVEKEVKQLRRTVRSTTWTKDTSAHSHTFGEESHVKSDTFKKTCTSCGYESVFEKL